MSKVLLDNFIVNWNNEHPYDYRWRKKYNVPFGSKKHKGITFFDQVFDEREEELFKKFFKDSEEKRENEENEMVGLKANKRILKMNNKEINDEFENLDLSDYLPDDK